MRNVPILIPAKGEADCHGVWNERPELNCQAKMTVDQVLVHTDPPKRQTIVDARDLRGKGNVKVTLKQVEFSGDLEAGKSSKGKASGVVSYEEGFKISYESENVNFADLTNLANLKLEGSAKVKGSTQGTAKWGVIDMNFDGKDLWLEDYPLGQVSSKITYKSGHLRFDQAQGQYGVTQYNGDIDLDLRAKRLKLKTSVPFAELKDIQALFQRKVSLPIQASGTGTGQLEAEGPFRFQDLSYKLRSSFYRGEIARESFDDLVFNVTSKDGLVTSDRISLTKSSGIIEAKGQVSPAGMVDTVVVGRGMRLEQSENFTNFGLALQGLADFTVLIRGQLPRPRVELNGRMSRMVMADQPVEDSVFKLNFLSDRMEGAGQFLGSTVLADLTYPYGDEAPFLLRLKARKWDFTSLFSLVSKSARQMDFST
ncbi:MAG: hypothetical protein HC902_09090, partial [Calothrix sp. SM1_5_4]|nr:hypothetical protein [Calothrix sp. SM1_5_4]